jgi:hypothetical protein
MAIYLLGSVSFLLMMTGVVVGNWSTGKMLEKVNQHRVPGTYITEWDWHFGKLLRVAKLYRSLQLEGSLLTLQTGAFVTGLVGFFGLAATLLILPHSGSR